MAKNFIASHCMSGRLAGGQLGSYLDYINQLCFLHNQNLTSNGLDMTKIEISYHSQPCHFWETSWGLANQLVDLLWFDKTKYQISAAQKGLKYTCPGWGGFTLIMMQVSVQTLELPTGTELGNLALYKLQFNLCGPLKLEKSHFQIANLESCGFSRSTSKFSFGSRSKNIEVRGFIFQKHHLCFKGMI